MKKTLIIASVLAIYIGGCATTGSNSAFDQDGYPKHQYYVGGGFNIEYTTQEKAGTLIFADSVSRTTILTKTMRRYKDIFTFSIEPENKKQNDKLKILGINPDNMKLSLYFIPSKETPELKGLQAP